MRGICIEKFGGPEVLQLKTLPDLSPGPNQVVVAIKAIGVNPKDTHYRMGLYPHMHSPPFTPGIDGAGIVASIGSGITHLKVGERVFLTRSISGTYAEYTLCDGLHVHLLPETISFSQGAAIGVPYATAFRALFQRAKVLPGETILINGATGGVGLAALQFARASCLRIIGVAGSREGLEFIKKEGADLAISYKESDYLNKMLELNKGKKVDVILEMKANVNLGHSLQVLTKNGRVVIIGGAGSVEIDPQYLRDTDSSILSVSLLIASEPELKQIYSGLRIGLEREFIKPIISIELPLSESAKAHELVEESGHIGKIILIP